MNNESKRHHYILQFIIRYFSKDESGLINYFDIKRKCFLNEDAKNVFMFENLYRDDINNPKDPLKIERDFAKYESEVAPLFEKFQKGTDIVLSTKENSSVLLFLTLLQLRSVYNLKYFGDEPPEEVINLLKGSQPDGDFVSMWRRNLSYVVNCRSIEEVELNENIDEIFKNIIFYKTFGLLGMYLIVAERRGPEDFFLSDTYPILMHGEIDENIKLPLMAAYPISPSRVLIAACQGIEQTPKEVRMFDKSFYSRPYFTNNNKDLIIHVRKIYEHDIKTLNNSIMAHTKQGVVVLDKNRFFVHIRDYLKQ